jgi:hypothetical protein
VPAHARAADDALYRAVDTYLKVTVLCMPRTRLIPFLFSSFSVPFVLLVNRQKTA